MFGVRRDRVAPLTCALREFEREGWQEPADATAGLSHVHPREHACVDQLKHESVDVRAGCLHEVEGEGVAGAVVGMPNAETRIKAQRETGNPRLSLEDRVQVVEDRVGGRDGDARPARERAVSCANAVPMVRDTVEVASGKPQR
jgi:hypothetical protein